MSRKPKNKKREEGGRIGDIQTNIHPDIRKTVWTILFLGIAVLFILAGVSQAGPWGEKFYLTFNKLFGWGYYLFPLSSFLLAFSFITTARKFFGLTLVGGILFVMAGLGFMDIVYPGSGGLTGTLVGSLKDPFGVPASVVITLTILFVSFLVTLNRPIRFSFSRNKKDDEEDEVEPVISTNVPDLAVDSEIKQNKVAAEAVLEKTTKEEKKISSEFKALRIKNYTPPPLKLLVSTIEKPTIGDLRANANIIKRTLDGFGISVEMGEVAIGPAVTRFTLKPAEGVKLSKITALNSDLALALAAHPIRIEAPIPGKSLVGIEVPNKSAALVRLGSLLLYPDFEKGSPLAFALGRNVSGDPIFSDIAKMPHLLIAGATGSGKSITIHSLLISLLYRNSPDTLRMILIDPKRVELSIYDGIPHLMSPVITENKKAMGALRWAIQEMDRRYQLLLEAGARDIKSYNKNSYKLPYLLIVIDELADLMSSYGREVEGSIIRLAQMSRATGIHLVVSTQRPSVEVITGLIKANITSRVALQVASQVDSRTILDTGGAEKLLGHGDLLLTSAELSKPQRIQGAYLTEDEIKNVLNFIKDNNKPLSGENDEEVVFNADAPVEASGIQFDNYSGDSDDELYDEAVETVRAAKKASASLLQRRLKVGYARAARLLDIMEEKGVVGPGDGAKPREVY
ncbi:MAG: DNA translocase FtsK [Patescibacteria group bacterium]